MKYFRLLPEVYLVVGKRKSLLQNIVKKRCLWIDETLSCIIKSCEKNIPIKEEQHIPVLKELCENNWGYMTDSAIFVDKLRLTNVFNEKKFHKDVPMVVSAVIKLTNLCNLDCSFCGNRFCPTCFKHKLSQKDQLDLSNWKELVFKLKEYGCKNISLTGGEASLSPIFLSLCEYIFSLGLNVTVNTNGLNPSIRYLNKKTPLIVSLFDRKNLFKVIEILKAFSSVFVLSYFSLTDKEKKYFPVNWKVEKGLIKNPVINKTYLKNMDIQNFFIKKERNKCLNSKMVILENLDVYPCFGSIKEQYKIGNIKCDKWNLLIKNLSQKVWFDKIDNHFYCKRCEFRYVCDSCVFMYANENCSYDIEGAVWK